VAHSKCQGKDADKANVLSPSNNDLPLSHFGLLGLRILEATGADIEDLVAEHGHRVLRVVGKGTKLVLVPLPPAVARAIDDAVWTPGRRGRSCSPREARGSTGTPPPGASAASPKLPEECGCRGSPAHAPALHVAVGLGVSDLLAARSPSVGELPEATRCDPRSHYRLLRALGRIGVYEEPPDHRFRSTAPGEALRSDAPRARRRMGCVHRPALLLAGLVSAVTRRPYGGEHVHLGTRAEPLGISDATS
jgi:hypothetical protein